MKKRIIAIFLALSVTTAMLAIAPASAYAATTTVGWNTCSVPISAYPNATLNLPAHSNRYLLIRSSATYYQDWMGWLTRTSYRVYFYDGSGKQVWVGSQLSGTWVNYYVGSNVRRIVLYPGAWNFGFPPTIAYG